MEMQKEGLLYGNQYVTVEILGIPLDQILEMGKQFLVDAFKKKPLHLGLPNMGKQKQGFIEYGKQ